MRRVWGVAALAAMSFGVMAGTASADPPIKLPPGGEITVFTGPTPCGEFRFDAVDAQKGIVKVMPDGSEVLLFSGGLKGTLTSLSPPYRSMSFVLPGNAKYGLDGIVGAGQWLLFGPTVLRYASGQISVPGYDLNQVTATGSVVELCPILNP